MRCAYEVRVCEGEAWGKGDVGRKRGVVIGLIYCAAFREGRWLDATGTGMTHSLCPGPPRLCLLPRG